MPWVKPRHAGMDVGGPRDFEAARGTGLAFRLDIR